MEQIVDNTLIVPSLDVLVPQMANQLLEVCRQLDTPIPELAVEVPKISSPSRHCRRRVRFAEQTAEQLVEVPTIISCSPLQFSVVECETSVFKVFFPDRVQQRRIRLRNAFLSGLWTRSLILALLVNAFKIFAQFRVHLHLQMGLVFGFFRTFPQIKKSAGLSPHSGSELAATLGSTTTPAVASVAVTGPVAFSFSRYPRLDSGHYFFEVLVLASACPGVLASIHGCFWKNFSSLGDSAQAVRTWRLGRPLVSVRMLMKEFPLLCVRAIRTWNLVHYYRVPVSGSHCSGRLGVAYGHENWNFREIHLFRWRNTWLDSGYMLCVSLLVIMDEFHTFSTLRQTWILKRFFSIRFEWRSVPSRCFWLQFCFARFAFGNTGRTFTSFTWLSCVMKDRFFAAQCGIFRPPPSELRPCVSGYAN